MTRSCAEGMYCFGGPRGVSWGVYEGSRGTYAAAVVFYPHGGLAVVGHEPARDCWEDGARRNMAQAGAEAERVIGVCWDQRGVNLVAGEDEGPYGWCWFCCHGVLLWGGFGVLAMVLGDAIWGFLAVVGLAAGVDLVLHGRD